MSRFSLQQLDVSPAFSNCSLIFKMEIEDGINLKASDSDIYLLCKTTGLIPECVHCPHLKKGILATLSAYQYLCCNHMVVIKIDPITMRNMKAFTQVIQTL